MFGSTELSRIQLTPKDKGGTKLNRIKFFRESKGLTVKALSQKSNVAAGYLCDLENGNKSNPSKEVMQKISAALEQTVTEVFFPEEKEAC